MATPHGAGSFALQGARPLPPKLDAVEFQGLGPETGCRMQLDDRLYHIISYYIILYHIVLYYIVLYYRNKKGL